MSGRVPAHGGWSAARARLSRERSAAARHPAASHLTQGSVCEPHPCHNSHAGTIDSAFAWLIRASGLIWGSMVHQINPEAPIHHDLLELGISRHTRVTGAGRAGPGWGVGGG